MGGRANAGNNKLFSNIDVARNAHLRAARAKEIEAEREHERQNPKVVFSKITQKQLDNMSPLQRAYMRVEIALETNDVVQLNRATSDVYEHMTRRQKVGNLFTNPDKEERARRVEQTREVKKEINRAYRKLGRPDLATDG